MPRRYRNSHAIWVYTVLTAIQQRWHSRLYRSQLSLLSCVHGVGEESCWSEWSDEKERGRWMGMVWRRRMCRRYSAEICRGSGERICCTESSQESADLQLSVPCTCDGQLVENCVFMWSYSLWAPSLTTEKSSLDNSQLFVGDCRFAD